MGFADKLVSEDVALFEAVLKVPGVGWFGGLVWYTLRISQVLLLLLRTAAAVSSHGSMQNQHVTAEQPLRPTKPSEPAEGGSPKKPSQTHSTHGGHDLSAWAAAKPAEVANVAMIVRPLDESVKTQDDPLTAKVEDGNDLTVAGSDPEHPGTVDAEQPDSKVPLEAGGSQGKPRMDESKWDGEKLVVSMQAEKEDTKGAEAADHGQESEPQGPCEPGDSACLHNLNTTLLRGKEEHDEFGMLGRKNSPVTIIMVLAISAGCTGCGLMSIILTGVYSLARAINQYLQREPSEAEIHDIEIPLEVMRDLTPDPPKPVVILGPDNGVVVGFEVLVVPSKIEKQSSTSSSLEEISIDVDAGAFSQGLPSPPRSLPPRSMLLSPLGPRNLRHDRWEAGQGLQSPPVSHPAQPQQDMARNPSSPPLLPPQSPE